MRFRIIEDVDNNIQYKVVYWVYDKRVGDGARRIKTFNSMDEVMNFLSTYKKFYEYMDTATVYKETNGEVIDVDADTQYIDVPKINKYFHDNIYYMTRKDI